MKEEYTFIVSKEVKASYIYLLTPTLYDGTH